jgi:hypothetical protein
MRVPMRFAGRKRLTKIGWGAFANSSESSAVNGRHGQVWRACCGKFVAGSS